MRRYQPRVFHTDTTVGQKEFPAEIVDLEPALLACGKPADLGADSAAVDGEIVDHGVVSAEIERRKSLSFFFSFRPIRDTICLTFITPSGISRR